MYRQAGRAMSRIAFRAFLPLAVRVSESVGVGVGVGVGSVRVRLGMRLGMRVRDRSMSSAKRGSGSHGRVDAKLTQEGAADGARIHGAHLPC